MNLVCLHGSLSESAVSAMYAACSGLQRPSWDKLNHQNCAAKMLDTKDRSTCVRACFARGIMLAPPEYAMPEASSDTFFFCTKSKLLLLPVPPLLFQSPIHQISPIHLIDRGRKRA